VKWMVGGVRWDWGGGGGEKVFKFEFRAAAQDNNVATGWPDGFETKCWPYCAMEAKPKVMVNDPVHYS